MVEARNVLFLDTWCIYEGTKKNLNKGVGHMLQV